MIGHNVTYMDVRADDGASGTEELGGESVFTVLVAAAANLGIALAKAVAGVISGSSAMLSEAAHSFADTVTELLLLTSLKRSDKPADEEHPLGYGGERYVWALLAADATFAGDGGGKVKATVRCVVGADRVGRLVVGIERKWMGADTRHDIVTVNGTPGLLTWRNGVPDAITSFHVEDGRIAAIYVVRNPDKLCGLARIAR